MAESTASNSFEVQSDLDETESNDPYNCISSDCQDVGGCRRSVGTQWECNSSEIGAQTDPLSVHSVRCQAGMSQLTETSVDLGVSASSSMIPTDKIVFSDDSDCGGRAAIQFCDMDNMYSFSTKIGSSS